MGFKLMDLIVISSHRKKMIGTDEVLYFLQFSAEAVTVTVVKALGVWY